MQPLIARMDADKRIYLTTDKNRFGHYIVDVVCLLSFVVSFVASYIDEARDKVGSEFVVSFFTLRSRRQPN